jgi:hypothetical protein
MLKMSLNTRTIRSLVKAQRPGMWAARGGLNLIISASGSATWALRWTCPDKVESFPEMKGELDDQAEGFYERV